MKDFVAELRGKPEHVRKRIALGGSVGITALVGIIWGATLTTTGTFALSNDPTPGEAGNPDAYVLSGTGVESNFSQLLGAVGAATGASSSKPSLTIIDGETSSTFETKAPQTNPSATVLPF